MDAVHVPRSAVDNRGEVEDTRAEIAVPCAVRPGGIGGGGGAPTGEDLRPLLAGLVHVGRDLLPLCLRDERTRLGHIIAGSAEFDALGTCDDRGDELIVQRFLDDDAGTCRADLAGVEERAVERVIDSNLEVGIGEDDVRVLAAEFQGRALDGLRRIAGDDLAGGQATGEGDHVDVGVLG